MFYGDTIAVCRFTSLIKFPTQQNTVLWKYIALQTDSRFLIQVVSLSAIFLPKLCHYIPQIDLQWKVISFYSLTALWEKGRKNPSPKEQHNSFQAELRNIHSLLCASADTDPPALWEDECVYCVEEMSSRVRGESKAFGQMRKILKNTVSKQEIWRVMLRAWQKLKTACKDNTSVSNPTHENRNNTYFWEMFYIFDLGFGVFFPPAREKINQSVPPP